MRSFAAILFGVLFAQFSFSATPPNYTFAPSGKDGGGCMVSVAPDPFTPGRVIAGGDSWPFHRTTNYGRDWTPVAVRDASDNTGLFNSANNMSAAATRFSLKTTNLVYAATGVILGGGGFLRSTNGGSTWVKASTIPTFVGDNDGAPLVTQGHPRSVGNLIALDPTGTDEYIYVGTYSNGVMRSHDQGNTWTTISIPGLTPPFIRGIAMSDVDPTTVYVACYDTSSDGTNESIYQIQNARTAASATLVSQAPFSKAEEIVVVNGVLYVAANTNGIYKYDPAGQAWTQLYHDTTPSQFYSIDGFWDGNTNQAVLFAGTTTKAKPGGNGLVFSLLRTKDSGSNWICLTTNTSQIHSNMVMGGPGGDIWWLSTAGADNVTDCLGGSQFVACQIVVDPSDSTHKTVYVCGHSGLWRSDDALTTDNPVWYPCMRHLQAAGSAAVVADPNSPTRAACEDVDWTFQYSTNNFSNVIQKKTSLGGSDEWCLETDSSTAPGNVSALYLGRDTDLLYCANPSTSSWVSTGLGTAIQANVYGSSIKFISGIGTVVLAGVENSGVWRKIGAGNIGSWGAAPIFSGNNVMQNTSSSLRAVFSWGGGNSQMVYLNDRVNGIFRSLDAGVTWTLIAATSGSQRTGSVTVDPTDDTVCYFTRTTGLFVCTNANAASPVFTKVTLPGLVGSVTPGWVVCDDAGNVYVNTLINTSNQPKLFYKAKGDSTWDELSQGDPVFESMCGTTIQMAVGPGPAHVIYLSGLGMAVGTQSYQVPTLRVSVDGSGTNLIFSGSGNAGVPYSVLSSTNLTLPTAAWSVLTTQTFDADGTFEWTNSLDASSPWQFYRLMVP